jgi:hypothetical protein
MWKQRKVSNGEILISLLEKCRNGQFNRRISTPSRMPDQKMPRATKAFVTSITWIFSNFSIFFPEIYELYLPLLFQTRAATSAVSVVVTLSYQSWN